MKPELIPATSPVPQPKRRGFTSEWVLQEVQGLLRCLMIGMVPEYASPARSKTPSSLTDADVPIISWRPMDRDDIARISKAVDGQFRLLAKLMPDLKSIEFNDTSSASKLNALELAQRLRGVNALVEQNKQPRQTH